MCDLLVLELLDGRLVALWVIFRLGMQDHRFPSTLTWLPCFKMCCWKRSTAVSSVSIADHPSMKRSSTLIQLIFVEFPGLTSASHLVDLANAIRTTTDETCNPMADLVREPILLSLLFFLFLSFIPCEDVQYLVSDILLPFRILLGLPAPEFTDLDASDGGSMNSRREGQIVPYPILKTVLSRWFRSSGPGIWTIQDIEDLWVYSSLTYASALGWGSTNLSTDARLLVSFVFGLSIDTRELGLFLLLLGFSMIQEVLNLRMGFQERSTLCISLGHTLPVKPRPSSILSLASAFSFSTLSL